MSSRAADDFDFIAKRVRELQLERNPEPDAQGQLLPTADKAPRPQTEDDYWDMYVGCGAYGAVHDYNI
jgi:hypothetical protein